jgi:hypothetical protein
MFIKADKYFYFFHVENCLIGKNIWFWRIILNGAKSFIPTNTNIIESIERETLKFDNKMCGKICQIPYWNELQQILMWGHSIQL